MIRDAIAVAVGLADPAQQVEHDPQPDTDRTEQREIVKHGTTAFRRVGRG